MHPDINKVLIRRHMHRTCNVFDYDKEITVDYKYMGINKFYLIMNDLTKDLKRHVDIHISKWRELDFIEWKVFVENNPLITIFSLKFVGNSVTMFARLTDMYEEYGFK